MQQNEEMNQAPSTEAQLVDKQLLDQKQKTSSEADSDENDLELDEPVNKEAAKEEQEDDVASDNLSVHSKQSLQEAMKQEQVHFSMGAMEALGRSAVGINEST